MKNIIIAAVIVLVIAGAVALRVISTSNAATTPLDPTTKLYDVRTLEEYRTAHVETATLFPVTDMQNGKFPDVPKDTPIALYCRSGHRAGQALELMRQAGFTNVRNLGGLNDLSKYGLAAK